MNNEEEVHNIMSFYQIDEKNEHSWTLLVNLSDSIFFCVAFHHVQKLEVESVITTIMLVAMEIMWRP